MENWKILDVKPKAIDICYTVYKKVLVTGGRGLNSTEIQDNDDQCKNTFAVMQSLN